MAKTKKVKDIKLMVNRADGSADVTVATSMRKAFFHFDNESAARDFCRRVPARVTDAELEILG